MNWLMKLISDHVHSRRLRKISRLGGVDITEAERWVEEERSSARTMLQLRDDKINRIQKTCDDAVNAARADRDQKVAAANTELHKLQQQTAAANKRIIGLLDQIRAEIELSPRPTAPPPQPAGKMPTLADVMKSTPGQVVVR